MQPMPSRSLIAPCRLLLVVVMALGAIAALAADARADLVLETETAELGKQGTGNTSYAIQFEKESDGSTTQFTLNQIEYAITDRAEILIEPFFHEWNQPKGEDRFDGAGDLEITPSYMVIVEEPSFPAVVLAFKLKVPTARNRKIGSGEYDYYPYVILGKTWDGWVFNVNLGYNWITSPRDEPLRNQFIYDLSIEREFNETWSVFLEFFGNSSPAKGEAPTFAGALAAEYSFTENLSVFVSIGDDTTRLKVLRFGFNVGF